MLAMQKQSFFEMRDFAVERALSACCPALPEGALGDIIRLCLLSFVERMRASTFFSLFSSLPLSPLFAPVRRLRWGGMLIYKDEKEKGEKSMEAHGGPVRPERL